MFIISNGFKDTVTCCGRTIFVGNDTEEMGKAIRDYIEEEQYTPTVVFDLLPRLKPWDSNAICTVGAST